MKKLVLLSCIPICMAMQEAIAQTVYVDVPVAPAMVTYAEALKSWKALPTETEDIIVQLKHWSSVSCK